MDVEKATWDIMEASGDGVTDSVPQERVFLVFIAVFSVLAVADLIAYTLVTGHIWEDFFITFRCSENLVDGDGLVYQAGERVHAFTSPLGVLLPALCHLLTGKRSYLAALWCFRLLFCVPAFVGSGIFLVRSLKRSIGSGWLVPCSFLALFFLFDVKAVSFSMNGMETALMLFFLAWSLFGLLGGERGSWLAIGLAWGGLMWTRPDGCVYIAAMGMSVLAFPASRQSRTGVSLSLLKSAAVTTAVYLPWFLWAWWYYGTPVPHTVFAKSATNNFSFSSTLLGWMERASWAFGPIYAGWARSWPVAVAFISMVLALFAMFYWVLARSDRFGRCLSLSFFIVSFYLATMEHPYPWYYPPLTMIGWLVLVNGVWRLLVPRGGKVWRILAIAILSAILFDTATLFTLTTIQMKRQQALIENGVRKRTGLWLRDHVGRGETIYLECLGYIGYFSGGHMLDYPGLASPRVVEAVKRGGGDMIGALLDVSPDWAVLRYGEAKRAAGNPLFRKRYAYVCHFSAVDELEEIGFFPGVEYLRYDATFLVFRKKKPETRH